jgi:hypothetical protein
MVNRKLKTMPQRSRPRVSRKGATAQIVGGCRLLTGLLLQPAFFVTSLANLASRSFRISLEAAEQSVIAMSQFNPT